jgi:hypothetical protein
VTADSTDTTWRGWLADRFARPAQPGDGNEPSGAETEVDTDSVAPVDSPADTPGESELDAFARRIDVTTLSTAEFVQLVETLHMLGRCGSGIELTALSTGVLADIVAHASRDQLKALSGHAELRYVFIDEIFRRMSDHVVAEKLRDVCAVVGWRFTEGAGEDGYDRYQTVLEDGSCVSAPDLGRTPDTTLTLSVDDFMRLATGNAAAPTMFVTGRVRLKGDYALAMRLSGYFDIPGPQ